MENFLPVKTFSPEKIQVGQYIFIPRGNGVLMGGAVTDIKLNGLQIETINILSAKKNITLTSEHVISPED